jgi:hypothetical protein
LIFGWFEELEFYPFSGILVTRTISRAGNPTSLGTVAINHAVYDGATVPCPLKNPLKRRFWFFIFNVGIL